MASNVYKKGLALRQRLLGKRFVDAIYEPDDTAERDVQALVTEFDYGAVWCRPGLEMATRSLITIALLASQDRLDTMRQHVRGALNMGATRDQILESLIHIMPYCGVPACVQAVRAANSVFHEDDKKNRSNRKPSRRKS
jgi:4-carboxymuconolactone decarboxylase